ncbi:dolichyl-diphosphooligosaccharide--protein glycosyltransferase subunit 2 [Dendroctonus ponderosae]
MTAKLLLVFLLATITLQFSQGSIEGFIPPRYTKLLDVAHEACASTGNIPNIYYAANIYKQMNYPVPENCKKPACEQLLKALSAPGLEIDVLFLGLGAQKILNCEGNIPKDRLIKEAQAVLQSEKSTVPNLHYAATVLVSVGQQVPNGAKIAQLAQAQLKTDDSVVALGHALHLAALLGDSGKFIIERIEDIVVQADEIDGKLLQWEGGLSTTSLVLTGLLKFPTVKSLNQVQADKIANYLLSRVTVQTPRGVSSLLDAGAALSSSKLSPVSISIVPPPIVSEIEPNLRIHVSDMLGRAVQPALSPVVAQSATRIADDVVVLAKQPLSVGTEKTEYILPLKLEPGFYKILLNVGSHSVTFKTKVVGRVQIESCEVGLSDADGSSAPRLEKINYGRTLSNRLNGDSGQKLIIKFTLTRQVHQAFVRLSTASKEIFFVAGQESNNQYKVEADLGEELPVSDIFKVEIIVGDYLVIEPVKWLIGEIELKASNAAVSASSKPIRGPKPEIRHMFRQPDKRPAQAVSLLFTALTAAPFLVLLILWNIIGVNLSNFSVRAVPFHLGFGAILGLFTLFWLKLNMFTTCAWLVPIGGFTFVAGQRLLSSISRSKKAEK